METKSFTVFGFLLVVVLFLMMATGKYAKLIVAFLAVVLLSMVLLNWAKIEPLLLRRA